IPTFFFLTQVFGMRDYGSPYRNVEKGLLLLLMLVKMNIASHIHKLDAIAIDGSYSGFVRQIVESSDPLSYENFSYPVHNTRGMAMADQELHYNKVFGGFRSSIEGCFGDMQSTFSKFTHDAPIHP
ncbi:hypothetical protein BCR41DRAFT_305782, partial [Lobosporangium transversale]